MYDISDRLVPLFISRARQGKELIIYDRQKTLDFTYVDDIARGTILGLKPLGFEIINLGGHETISINALIQMLEGMLNRKAHVEHLPTNPAEMLANHADVRKAGELLGWEAQVSLKTGVQRLVDWYLAERSWVKNIETK